MASPLSSAALSPFNAIGPTHFCALISGWSGKSSIRAVAVLNAEVPMQTHATEMIGMNSRLVFYADLC